MDTYRYKQIKEEKQRTNIWDAFVSHLESTYFPGASELLDKKLYIKRDKLVHFHL
jgi:hypothetical protein